MAGLGVIVAGVVLFNQSQSQSARRAKGDAWSGLLAAEGDLEAVQAAASELNDPPLNGWGQALVTQQALALEKPEIAAAALTELTATSDHILNSTAFGVETEDGRISPAAYAQKNLSARLEWEEAHPEILSNVDPAEGSPKVVFHTSEGDIEVTLYEAKAPKHVENFLKLTDEDFYDGILFHRVINSPGMAIIQAGDPNTKEEDVTKWGQGGPGYTQEAEKNDLIHDEGYLSAAMPGNSKESSGSQFFFTMSRTHHLDDRHTIFGKITGGMDIATTILKADIRDEDPDAGTKDIPVNPISITSIERQ
ncbi:MAG: peptidylprolyl isomerase [bacterium]|nr:peptidylprolyl isomerase [bacterium]